MSKFYWAIVKHSKVLPSNEDFKKLEPQQAYWYYCNLADDAEKLDEAYNKSKNKGSITKMASGSESDFIKSVKKDLLDKKNNKDK